MFTQRTTPAPGTKLKMLIDDLEELTDVVGMQWRIKERVHVSGPQLFLQIGWDDFLDVDYIKQLRRFEDNMVHGL